MTSCYIPQIFLWFAVQNQFCIRQRVVVNKIIQFRPLCAAALFKSSYPRLLLKGNGHVKQKRQLSKAVFFVVRVVIQNFSKNIVVQFVFKVIG